MTADPMPLRPGEMAAPAVSAPPVRSRFSKVSGSVQGAVFYGLLAIGLLLPVVLILIGELRG